MKRKSMSIYIAIVDYRKHPFTTYVKMPITMDISTLFMQFATAPESTKDFVIIDIEVPANLWVLNTIKYHLS